MTTTFQGAIFDVDGVLVDSPHEQAWRDVFRSLLEFDWRDPRDQRRWPLGGFTPVVYQQLVAGVPRVGRAQTTPEHFGEPDVEARIEQYAAESESHVIKLIEEGRFMTFPDALRFILVVKNMGIPVAAASSSKNARRLLGGIRLDTFAAEQRLEYDFIRPGMTLQELFDADVSGRDLTRGEPGPAVFLTAAEELGVASGRCFVVTASPRGIEAAKAAGIAALGVARLDNRAPLVSAGGDLVVTTLDDTSVSALAEGTLQERGAAAELPRRFRQPPPSVWSLVHDGFDPGRRGLGEALFALGNGYLVTRGALPEARADEVNYPGTYLAGLYNRADTEVAGRTIVNEDLVNVPNWLPLEFRVAGREWFDVERAEVLDHRLELDMRRGTLTRHLHWQEPDGRRTRVAQRRFVSMHNEHLAGLETTFTAENWSGRLEVRSGIDGRVVNCGVKRYRDLNSVHLELLGAAEVDSETVDLQVETTQSHVRIAVAARTRLLREGRITEVDRHLFHEPGFIGHALTLELEEGHPATVEKVVALYTSRDRAVSESRAEARLTVMGAEGYVALQSRHEAAWNSLWNRFDIELDVANARTETVLHLHIFHLLQTVSPHTINLDVGVPARGWHGEAYRGHIFWDELFIFPFLNYQQPVLARSLLDYRHARLNTARAAARLAGYEGAMFPWQSGSNGNEETQEVHLNPQSGRWLPDHSHLQRHVNIAIAYNVWQHYQVTGSVEFLRFTGTEMLIEIARFWASMTTWNQQQERYEILGVMGPDEYHDAYPDSDQPGLNNNTYTNVMAVWVLQRALDALEILPPHYRLELIDELTIRDNELARWLDITRKMRVVFHSDGVLTQFERYEDLREFDWEGYREKYGNIQRLDRLLEAEGDSPNNYKLAKQADVLMLLFLLSRDELRDLLKNLGYQVSDDQLDRTVTYHLEHTSHGSTLSGVVSAWVLARHEPEQAWQFLLGALESDVADVQGGTTAEGIHLGAMAGTVDIVLRCLTGMQARGEVLRFDPALPPEVKELKFSVHYRGHRVDVALGVDHMEVQSRPGGAPPIKVLVQDVVIELRPGARHRFSLARP